MKWSWDRRKPEELRRIFAWFPIQVSRSDYCHSRYYHSRWVWLETLYCKQDYDDKDCVAGGWVYYTREEAILKRLLSGTGVEVS